MPLEGLPYQRLQTLRFGTVLRKLFVVLDLQGLGARSRSTIPPGRTRKLCASLLELIGRQDIGDMYQHGGV
ncbi:hypothetical protein GCM10027399_20090 [Curvibacter fontanus]